MPDGWAAAPTGGAPEPLTRRERTRAATLEEIKRTALVLMREHGSLDVRFTDIARAMGLTPPALYRYFADRDELLTAVLIDSYGDLAADLAAAREPIPDDDLEGRFLAICAAYRRWATTNPERFSLAFGMPVPGYAPPRGSSTASAVQQAMAPLADLLAAAERRAGPSASPWGESGPAFAVSAADTLAELGVDISVGAYQSLVLTWGALHGFVSLEVNGHFHWMADESRDELFDAQVRTTAMAAGLRAVTDLPPLP